MTKVSRKPFPEDRMGLYIDEFWRAVTLLESKEEVQKFFRDILTHTERKMLAKRLQIAKLLLQKYDYEAIKKELAVGNATIAEIARWLDSFGDGYRLVVGRLLVADSRRQKKKSKGFIRLLDSHKGARLLATGAVIGAEYVHGRYRKFKKKKSA